MLPAHCCVVGSQVFPHPPQLLSSVCVSVQNGPPALVQIVWPVAQVTLQAPFEQTWPLVHRFPHAPQLLVSLFVFAQ